MKKLFSLFATLVIVSACGSNQPTPTSDTAATVVSGTSAQTVKVQSFIPYKKDAAIAANIKTECALNSQLSENIQAYGNDYNVAIVRSPSLNKDAHGKVLMLEITEAVSQGHAFVGHRKFVKIAGTLYNDGKKVAAYTATRFSGGGFWGAYKGSCSVLSRTVKTLGKDTALWLSSPVDGAHLGDKG